MKNPYMRYVLVISLLLSFVYVLTIIIQYNIISHTSLSIDTSRMSEGIVKTTSSAELPMKWMNILLYFVGFIQLIFAYIFGYDSGSALLSGIIMEYIGPLLVFISWFILLYFITKLYARLKMPINNGLPNQVNFDTNTYKISIGSLTIICIISVIVLTVGNFAYSYLKVKNLFNGLKNDYSVTKTLDSLKKVDEDPNLYTNKKWGFEFKYSNQYYLVGSDDNHITLDNVKNRGVDGFQLRTLIFIATSSSLDNFLSKIVDENTGQPILEYISKIQKISDSPELYKLYANAKLIGGVMIKDNAYIYILPGSGPSVDEIFGSLVFKDIQKISSSVKDINKNDGDFMKNWKVYKNSNVEFMYPPDFTNGVVGPGGGVMFYSNDKKVTLNLYPCCYPIPDGFDYENMKSTGMELTKVGGNFAVIKYSPLEIDGRIATKVGLVEVLLYFTDIQESQKYKDLFNKIFSTFKI